MVGSRGRGGGVKGVGGGKVRVVVVNGVGDGGGKRVGMVGLQWWGQGGRMWWESRE